MTYRNAPEYEPLFREKVEKALKNMFLGTKKIVWHNDNSHLNKVKKVDTTIYIMTDVSEVFNFQLKKTDDPNRQDFTINKTALKLYLSNNYPVNYLGVAFGYKKIFVFNWQDFIDFTHENLHLYQEHRDYYAIPIDLLLDNLEYDFDYLDDTWDWIPYD